MYKPYPDELYHYGVLGMRWGIRRYQPYTKGQKGTFLNLKKQYKKEAKSIKKEGKVSKEDTKGKLKELNKAYKEAKSELKNEFDAENKEAFKEKVMLSGSKKMVKKFSSELSNQELAQAIDRINLQVRLDQIKSAKQIDKEAKKAANAALKNAKKENTISIKKTLSGAAITGLTIKDLAVMINKKQTKDDMGRTSENVYSALSALNKGTTPSYKTEKAKTAEEVKLDKAKYDADMAKAEYTKAKFKKDLWEMRFGGTT